MPTHLRLAIAMLAICLIACSGSGSEPAPTSTSFPLVTPTAAATMGLPTPIPPVTVSPSQAYPTGTRTGVAVVDAVIAAAEARDAGALGGLIHYYELPCTPPIGIGAIPCEPGTVPDSPSVVIGGGQCEGVFYLKGDPGIVSNLDRFLNAPLGPVFDPRVYAVLKRPVFPTEPQIPGDYLIVFASAHAIEVDGQGMTYYTFPCSAPPNPADYVSGGAVAPGQTFLLAPR